MSGLVKKLLIGASVVVGFNAVATLPSIAASLTNITFDNDNYKAYYEDGFFDGDNDPTNNDMGYDGQRIYDKYDGTGRAIDNNEAKAIEALTDGDSYTNVELGYKSETQTGNMGFSGMLGDTAVKVETVTQEEWDDGVKDLWLGDFLKVYPELAPFSSLITQAARFGDPNVSSFNFNENTGEYQLGLIGHYDVSKISYLPDGTSDFISSLLGDRILQMSEIAKVTIGEGVNKEVHYAYGFEAEKTNVLAVDAYKGSVSNDYEDADTSSHTGLYTWTLQGEPTAVPEPSTMLGLMAVGGLVTLSRRKSRNQA